VSAALTTADLVRFNDNPTAVASQFVTANHLG
jgi:hypothetical protein